MVAKRLFRSKKKRIIAGVCGGIGDYFCIDPTLIRVLWILITAITGFFVGIFAYVVCIIIIPEE